MHRFVTSTTPPADRPQMFQQLEACSPWKLCALASNHCKISLQRSLGPLQWPLSKCASSRVCMPPAARQPSLRRWTVVQG